MSCTPHDPCAECRAMLERGRSTYETLALHHGESMTPIESARIWARIDTQRSRPRGFDLRRLFAIAAPAAAAISVFLATRPPAPQTEEWLVVQTGQQISDRGLELGIERAGMVWIEPGELTRELRVFRGVVTVE